MRKFLMVKGVRRTSGWGGRVPGVCVSIYQHVVDRAAQPSAFGSLTMKIVCLVLFIVSLLPRLSIGDIVEWPPAVINVSPELEKSVSARTPNNQIPWGQSSQKYSIKLKGVFKSGSVLSTVVKGNYSYTLHKFSYTVSKVFEGKYEGKELSFLIEHKFPTKESGIVYKDLWPFHQEKVLIFRLTEGQGNYEIVSIEQ